MQSQLPWRSWRSRRARLPLALAAALAIGASWVIAAPAGATVAEASAAKRCGTVTGATSGATWARVEIVGVRGVSCGGARTVIRRCLRRARVAGWRRTTSTAAAGLRRGRRRVRVRVLSDDKPTCLERGRRAIGAPAPVRLGATSWREAGPYQGALPMPPTSRVAWTWTSPIASDRVVSIDVGTARLVGAARTSDDDVRSVWFEYGQSRDLAREAKTASQAPKVLAGDAPWTFAQDLKGLRAHTRYYWRAATTLDDGTVAGKVAYGAIGSFVTEPYRDASGGNPCAQTAFGGTFGGTTQVTEALALVCSPRMELVNRTYLPLSVGYSGRLTCPREYPHNLNAGNVEVTIPEINYTVKFNDLVSYWRSNGSARFTTFPGYQQHFAGAEVGPLVGWHEWNIDEWGSLGSVNSTLVQLWINCTDNFQAYTPGQLARGQGDDEPSTAAPAAPTGFRFAKADGGWRGSWDAVRGGVSRVAGYELLVDRLQDSSTLARVLVTDTDTSSFISDAYVKAMADIYRTKRLYVHVWAISGEGVRSTSSATIEIAAP